jgi:hypothetical protein
MTGAHFCAHQAPIGLLGETFVGLNKSKGTSTTSNGSTYDGMRIRKIFPLHKKTPSQGFI